ncbi:V-set and immunoglobulin domain-containing protein 4-like isoform X2 [Ambystoma mexicanum]|uniref:V-set and immunoglobulin domain-containing protein 4-like isoform X2 n=1 Tax=Ambystoma mexicanum TaxID=8296 RepID=UPI0037E87E67
MAQLPGYLLLAAGLAVSNADFNLKAEPQVTGTWKRSVVLPCSYAPMDVTPHIVTWLFDGQTIIRRDASGDHTFLSKHRARLSLPENQNGGDVSLKIADLQTDDRGVYTCKVTLMLKGETDLTINEAIIDLNVVKVAVTKPAITPDGPFLKVPAGAQVILTCSAEGSPPIHFRWYKRGSSGSSKALQTERPSLTIRNTQSSDSGTYSCEVENSAPERRVQQSEELHLSIADDASATTTIAVGSTEERVTTGEPGITRGHRSIHTRTRAVDGAEEHFTGGGPSTTGGPRSFHTRAPAVGGAEGNVTTGEPGITGGTGSHHTIASSSTKDDVMTTVPVMGSTKGNDITVGPRTPAGYGSHHTTVSSSTKGHVGFHLYLMIIVITSCLSVLCILVVAVVAFRRRTKERTACPC